MSALIALALATLSLLLILLIAAATSFPAVRRRPETALPPTLEEPSP